MDTLDFIEGKVFDAAEKKSPPIKKAEYEDCQFKGFDFSHKDLSGYIFTDCTFVDCNFSLSILKDTAFKEVHFDGCKLMGLQFENCNDFGLRLSFSNCHISHVTFIGLNLKGTHFTNCEILESDFSEAKLMEASFLDCQLRDTIFYQTRLEKADFRTAHNFEIDPENNFLKNAKFSNHNLKGLLGKYQLNIKN